MTSAQRRRERITSGNGVGERAKGGLLVRRNPWSALVSESSSKADAAIIVMKIEHLGELTPYEGAYWSEDIYVPALKKKFGFSIDGVALLDNTRAIELAIRNLLDLQESRIMEAAYYFFWYYKETMELSNNVDCVIHSQAEVWKFISFLDTIYVQFRESDQKAYLLIPCRCAWCDQDSDLVLRNGMDIARIGLGSFHNTNAEAYGDPALENVIYHAMGSPPPSCPPIADAERPSTSGG
jgi:hypothetical protein